MKIQTVYTCEKCGLAYTDYDQAQEHEDSHILPKSWDLRNAGQYTSSSSKYPDILTIEMADGAEVQYGLLPIDKKEAPQDEQDGANTVETPSI